MTKFGNLEIDFIFEKKIECIERVPWASLKILYIQEIIKFLEKHIPSKYFQSYLLELIPIYITSINQLSHSNTCAIDPIILEDLILFFDYNVINKDKEYSQLLNLSVSCVLKIYLHLFEFEKVINIMHQFRWIDTKININFLINNFNNDYIRVYTYLISWLNSNLISKYKRYFNSVLTLDDKSSGLSLNGLFVVSDTMIKTGVIANVSLIKYQIERGHPTDQLKISSHLTDYRDTLSDQAIQICNFLKKELRLDSEFQLIMEYMINLPSSDLSGYSIGLALGFLGWISLIQHVEHSNSEMKIFKNVAFTGGISDSGEILSVDSQFLSYKVSAAFYGPIKYIVVPKNQLPICEKYLTILQKVHPRRYLKFIGADHISELITNKEIINFQPKPFSKRIKQWLIRLK